MAGDEMAEVIRYEEVCISYRNVPVVRNLSFALEEGEILGIVGESGSGKSTLIKAPMGLLGREGEVTGGRILFGNVNLPELKEEEVRKYCGSKIGMVFQDFRLLEKKTVYENVAFAMEVLHKSKREIRERVPYVLNLVDIADKANRYPDELSAGEQQRVGIARALVNKPRVLICDEPTGNLDPITAMDIMRLLEQINVRGTTVLMVTHAKDIVDQMNKRVVAIDNGRIVRDEEGSYGFTKQTEEEDDLYVPGFTTFIDNPFKTTTIPASAVKESSRGRTIAIPDPAGYDDSLIDAYLDGGEDVYE